MKGCTNYNSISGKHSTWMSPSLPVTNWKGQLLLIDTKSSKYLLQLVWQGLTEVHAMLIYSFLQKQKPFSVAILTVQHTKLYKMSV
jgi:hypothetical protein